VKKSTELIHHPYQPPAGFASPVQPVYKGSSVFMPSVAALKATAWKDRDAYTYGLHGTPTTFALESRIAALEGATHALLAPSGLAALNLVSHTLLRSGDQVCIPDNVYGPSRASCRHELAGWGVSPRGLRPARRRVLARRADAADAPDLAGGGRLGDARVPRSAGPHARGTRGRAAGRRRARQHLGLRHRLRRLCAAARPGAWT
jgi:cystathionine beta-lyase/cystathionine gamma-synthase